MWTLEDIKDYVIENRKNLAIGFIIGFVSRSFLR